ncbi:RibD family protein [Kineococcus terrestris]|uniref:RibD family protein n=1 Tax=Kineococcus terrestris TaxID=2044856 RepID=UPI0034DB0C3E
MSTGTGTTVPVRPPHPAPPPSPAPVDGAGAWPLLLRLAREEDPAVVAAALARHAADPLVHRYARLLAAGRTGVVAQLGQSLDGCIATAGGDSVPVTGEADHEHLHRLRALVDAVVVGPGTVHHDDPRLTVRAVPGPDPRRVVLDPAGRLRERALLRDPSTLWFTQCPVDSPGAQVVVLDVGSGPAEVLAVLREHGLRRVLVEGGGRTVSQWVDAGVVDRLFLTIAPLVIGRGGRRGLSLPDVEPLSACRRPPAHRHVLGEDVCWELDLRA